MKVAYRETWLQVLVSSPAEMRRGCGPAWVHLANLVVILGQVSNLQLLGRLPAVEVAVFVTGTVTYVLISLDEVVLRVTPYDDQAQLTTSGPSVDLARSTRLLLDGVRVRGAALACPVSA